MAEAAGEECDDESEVLNDFADICAEPPKTRDKCEKCKRPKTVCWCPFLPNPPPEVSTKVYILQHPFEETRSLRTGPMLYHGLPPGHCHIIKGKRFNTSKNPELADVIADPDTYLMYPGPGARELRDLARERGPDAGPCRLLLLDGTWQQAKGLYAKNKFLHSLKQVQLSNAGLSEYVIRTQPMDGCLSTLETAAISIALLEHKPHLSDVLIEPLRALCNFQLHHGAVQHQSKQHLIDNGLYVKQRPKDSKQKLIEKGLYQKQNHKFSPIEDKQTPPNS